MVMYIDVVPNRGSGTLLKEMSTRVRNRCRRPGGAKGLEEETFLVDTLPNATQQKAMDLLKGMKVYP